MTKKSESRIIVYMMDSQLWTKSLPVMKVNLSDQTLSLKKLLLG